MLDLSCKIVAEMVYGNVECEIDNIAWEERTVAYKMTWKIERFHGMMPSVGERRALVEDMLKYQNEAFFHERIRCLFEEYTNTNYSVAPGPCGEKCQIVERSYSLASRQNLRNAILEVFRWHSWGVPVYEGELDSFRNAEDQFKLAGHDVTGQLKKVLQA